ncbi:RICIN domain-containing protein [Streptomyces tsukubensis]|uniref:RICIN domain-containing protein n=1 Tax=Streptomyces tsukubensis TaxID=83656 RepID=UPI003698F475
MSDQNKASGESVGRPSGSAAAPDAEAVAAGLMGEEKPAAGPAPGTAEEESVPVAPEAGAGEAAGSAGSTASTANTAPPGGGPAAEEAAAGKSATTEPPEPTEPAATGEAAGTTATAESSRSGEAEGTGRAGSAAGTSGEARPAAAATASEGRRGLAAAAGSGGDTAGPEAAAPGRPGKPVLAGAAMVGVVLVAVPLLVMALGKDEEKKTVTTAAENVLTDEDDPAGAFVAESPAPSPPKPKAVPSATPEKKKQGAGPEKADPAAPPGAKTATTGGTDSTGGTGGTGGSGTAKTTDRAGSTQKKQKKTSGSLPSVMTRVLIKNNTNGTCVDIPGYSSGRPDTEVHHFTCNNTNNDNQLWTVEQRYATAGPGGVPLFQIRNVMDGMCLDLPGNGGVGGATGVTEYPCNGTTKDNQLWWLDKRADGKFWIRNFASNNQCLDSYSNSEKERQLIIWPCAPENQNNHEWTFTRS